MTYSLTGRDVTITIDGQDYTPRAASAEVTQQRTRETVELLTGPVDVATATEGRCELELLADWGADVGGDGPSFCGLLWTAAEDHPDTPLAVSMVVGGDTFAGTVLPAFPERGPGGEGRTAQRVRWVLPLAQGGEFSRTQAT